MPELPDVEVFRRYLHARALGQSVERVRVDQPYVLEGTSPQALGRRLRRQAFADTRRHGKNLFVTVASGREWLHLHFGMTGRLAYYASNEAAPAHTSVRFDFSNGRTLAHVDQRKLGKVGIVRHPDEYIAEHQLGPDALALGREGFLERAAQRGGGVKAWLMDQHALAGIGNVYADEILFRARLDPTTPLSTLGEARLEGLHEALCGVLDCAIEAGADPARVPADWLLPRRRRGATCPRCDTPLERRQVAGRTTWSCPICQRAGA